MDVLDGVCVFGELREIYIKGGVGEFFDSYGVGVVFTGLAVLVLVYSGYEIFGEFVVFLLGTLIQRQLGD